MPIRPVRTKIVHKHGTQRRRKRKKRLKLNANHNNDGGGIDLNKQKSAIIDNVLNGNVGDFSAKFIKDIEIARNLLSQLKTSKTSIIPIEKLRIEFRTRNTTSLSLKFLENLYPQPSLNHSLEKYANEFVSVGKNSIIAWTSANEAVSNYKVTYKIFENDYDDDVLDALRTINNADVIALDIEGINLSYHGEITTLQIAVESQPAYIFCMFKCAGLINLLRPAIESDKILKVVHGGLNDVVALKGQYDVTLEHYFDTQYAYKCIHKVPAVDYGSMVEKYGFLEAAVIKARYKKKTGSYRRNWLNTSIDERNLTDSLAEYAGNDVLPLLYIYNKMMKQLNREPRLMHEYLQLLNLRKAQLVEFIKHGKRNSLENDFISGRRWFSFNDNAMNPIYRAEEGNEEAYTGGADIDKYNMNDDEIFWTCVPLHIYDAILTEWPNVTKEVNSLIFDLNLPPRIKLQNKLYTIPNIASVTADDINYVCDHVGDFDENNHRVGISHDNISTLHYVSALYNNNNTDIIGISMMYGRVIDSNIHMITDIIKSDANILFIGNKSSVYMNAILRQIANRLSISNSVIIIDTYNEIGGHCEIPHQSIGSHTRRIQINDRNHQHETMSNIVENHRPDVVILGETLSHHDRTAAYSIIDRNIRVISSMNASSFHNTITNTDNILNIKSIHDRCAYDTVIEIYNENKWRIHTNMQMAIHASLSNTETDDEQLVEERKVIHTENGGIRYMSEYFKYKSLIG